MMKNFSRSPERDDESNTQKVADADHSIHSLPPPFTYPVQRSVGPESSNVAFSRHGQYFDGGDGIPEYESRACMPGWVVQRMMQDGANEGLDASVTQLLLADEIADLKTLGFTDSSVQYLDNKGFTYHQASYLYRIGFESEQLSRLSKVNGIEQNPTKLFNQILSLSNSPYNLSAEEIGRSYELFQGDYDKISQAHAGRSHAEVYAEGIKSGSANLWNQFFQDSQKLLRAYLARFTSEQILVFKNAGKTATDLEPLLNAGLDFDQIKLVLGQNRFGIPEIIKLLGRFEIGQIMDLTAAANSLTADQMVELDKLGMPLNSILALANASTAKVAQAIKDKFQAITFQPAEIEELYVLKFRIGDIVRLSKAQEGNSVVSIANIKKCADLKLSPEQITSAAETPYFKPEFLKALLVTDLLAPELISLMEKNVYSLPEIIDLRNTFKLDFQTIRDAQVAGIAYLRIKQMSIEAVSAGFNLKPRTILEIGPTPMSIATVKLYTDQKKSAEWILAKARSGFTESEVDSLQKVMTLKDIGRLGQHFSSDQVRFLIGKKFSVQNLQQLSQAGISFAHLDEYLKKGASPGQVLQMTSSGFTHDNIMTLMQEINNGAVVAALAATGFPFAKVVELKKAGFTYQSILDINHDAKLNPDQILGLKQTTQDVTNQEIVSHARTGFSVADLRKLKQSGLDDAGIMKAGELGYTYQEIAEMIVAIGVPHQNLSPLQRLQEIHRLRKTRFSQVDLVLLLNKNVPVDHILMLHKTRFSMVELLRMVGTVPIPNIVVASQNKFDVAQIQKIFAEKTTAQSASDKIGQVLDLGATKFTSQAIFLLFAGNFSIDQIIELGKSKLTCEEVLALVKLGASTDLITNVGKTGYSAKDITRLQKLAYAVNSSLNVGQQILVATAFGLNGFSFEEAAILLADPAFATYTENLSKVVPVINKYGFADLIFLKSEKGKEIKADPRALAVRASIDIRESSRQKQQLIDVSSWIPVWRKSIREIRVAISDLQELFAYPELYAEVTSAIDKLGVKLKEVNQLGALASIDSEKILNPGSEEVGQEKYFAGRIRGYMVSMERIAATASSTGPKSPAMSALGRAVDRGGKELAKTDMGVTNASRTLYNLLKVGGPGKDPQAVTAVFQPLNEVPEAPKGVLAQSGVNTVPISKRGDFSGNLGQVRQEIAQLPKPPDPGNFQVVYEGPAKRKDRGAGQASAMANYNAATYAQALNLIQNAGVTDWEWLHIRSAGLGGNTNSKNLLPGLSSANTLMIPFENNLKHLAQMSNRQRPLTVSFTATDPHNQSDGHAYRYIKITWVFGDNSTKDNLQKGEAIFDIIGGRVVTKGDITLLESYLKEKRNEIKME